MRTLALAVAVFAAVSCGGNGSARSATAPAAVRTLNALVIPTLMGIGETGQATTRLRTDITSMAVTAETWQTTNPLIASVNTDGIVSAVAQGTVSITGTYEGLSATVSLRIVSGDEVALSYLCGVGCGVPVTGGQVWRMTQGQMITFIPRATFDRTDISVAVYDVRPGTRATWTTSDPSILSVTADGQVTALAPGTANLTATWLGQSATVPVTVS